MFEVRKNCDDSGILFLLFAKYRMFEFLFFSRYNNSFYTHTLGRIFPGMLYFRSARTGNIHRKFYFTFRTIFYIYIFFLPLFLRSWKLLTKIANVSTRFKTLLPLTFDIPSYILRICAASRFSYFVPMSIANINKREILTRYNAQPRNQHAHRRLCTLLIREQECKKTCKDLMTFDSEEKDLDNIFKPANCSLNIANTRLSLKKEKKRKKKR